MKCLPVLLVAILFGGVNASHLCAQEGEGSVMPKTPETLSGKPRNYSNLARLPYRQLISIAQSDSSSKPEAESYKLNIKSRNTLVTSSDIELFLDLEKGPLVLVVDNDGFVEVPHTEALIEANPDLVANQPKGSLNIFVKLEIPLVEPAEIKDGKVAYQELFRPLIQIQKEMQKVDPTFGLTGQQQFILEVTTGGDPVKITRELGSRSFQPNEDGKVYMIMESYLYEENPEVQIPEGAELKVLPEKPENIEAIRSR
tara:strand:- start:2300 stop:3067 length:768 start_codon:yes stop_codon:yes gene_type:complete